MSEEVRRAVEALSEPGDVRELRALKNGTTAAGYFDDFEALGREAAKLDEQGFNVYVTANPVEPALLARADNRVKRPLRATTEPRSEEIPPMDSVYANPTESSELVPELRGLFHEHPVLTHRSPETVARALRALRGVEVDAFAVQAATEALIIEEEVLA